MSGPLLGALGLAGLSALLALADSRIRGLAINTLLLCGAVTGIVIPIALLLAVLLSRTDLPGRRLLLLPLLLLLFTPLYLQAAAWQAGFGLQGAILPAIADIAPTLAGGPLVFGWPGTIWVHSAASVGWAVLILIAALTSVEREVEELALLDASPGRVFWSVTIRRSLPAIVTAAIWVAVLTAGEMTVTNLFQVRTFTEELYTQLSFGESLIDITLAGSPAWLFTLVLIVGGLVAVDRFLTRALSAQARPLLFPLGRWRGAATVAFGFVLLVLIVVPIVSLVAKAGLEVTASPDGTRQRGWSAGKCLSMVLESPTRFRRELGWSTLLGASTAMASLALAVPLGWWARKSAAGRRATLLLAAIGLAVPGPVIGLVIIHLMNQRDLPIVTWLYDQTIAAPLLALLIRAFPVVSLIVWFALASLPRQLFDLADLDGISRWSQFVRIILPLRWPALLVAWLAAFAIALADLSSTILVLPPGVDTIALRMFERLHFGAEDQVSAFSLALLAMFAAIGGITVWCFSRIRAFNQ